uniref:Uncharacterized protein n=1 Tax=Anguilla anguilla TaxID=7936 RepID=A0A0E9UZI3_ANGAN
MWDGALSLRLLSGWLGTKALKSVSPIRNWRTREVRHGAHRNQHLLPSIAVQNSLAKSC